MGAPPPGTKPTTTRYTTIGDSTHVCLTARSNVWAGLTIVRPGRGQPTWPARCRG
jgi:hypothetical protein